MLEITVVNRIRTRSRVIFPGFKNFFDSWRSNRREIKRWRNRRDGRRPRELRSIQRKWGTASSRVESICGLFREWRGGVFGFSCRRRKETRAAFAVEWPEGVITKFLLVKSGFFRYFVFVLFLKWSTDEQYGRSQNVGRQSHESGKKRDAEGCFSNFFKALEVRFM